MNLHKFMQLANIYDQNEFYRKYPTEDAFFKDYPQAKTLSRSSKQPSFSQGGYTPNYNTQWGDLDKATQTQTMQGMEGMLGQQGAASASGALNTLSMANQIVEPIQQMVSNIESGLQQGLLSFMNVIPEAKPNKDVFRKAVDNPYAYGTGSQALFASGGKMYGKNGLQVYSGGNVETMGENPYTGNTLLFNGASHANGGIKITYDGNPVEVQGGEPAFKDREGSLVVLGGMKVPGMNKTFQSIGKQIGKEESYANKIAKKAAKIQPEKVYDKFSTLKSATSDIIQKAADLRLKQAAIKKENLADIQNNILAYAEATGQKPKKAAEKFAKNGIKVSYDDGQSWDDGKNMDLLSPIKPIIYPKVLDKQKVKKPVITYDKTYDLNDNHYNVPNFPENWSRRDIDNFLNQNPIDDISSYNQWNDYMEYGGDIPKAKNGYKRKKFSDEEHASSDDMTLAERNNNPGNLRDLKGNFMKFNTYSEGFEALRNKLNNAISGKSSVYKPDMTLYEFYEKYAPKEDKNNPKKYAEFVAGQIGVDPKIKIKNLGDKLDSWAKATAYQEDYKYAKKMENYVPSLKVPTPDISELEELKNIYPVNVNNQNVPLFDDNSIKINPQAFNNVIPVNKIENASEKLPSLADSNKLRMWDFLSDIPALFDTPDYVQGQQFNPRPYQPYQISLQDKLNENNSSFRAQAQQLANNPEALSILAAQKYQADNAVLSEQFRINQGITNDVYNKNVDLMNNADLKNLEFADQQYQRQTLAKSNTKARRQQALNDIQSKIAQNERDNMSIRLYENMGKFRMNDNGEMQNYNTANFYNSNDILPLDPKDQKAETDRKYKELQFKKLAKELYGQ